MTRAKERALEVYPRYEKYTTSQKLIVNDMRDGFIQGYEQAEKDILAIIEFRISEIIGDAQPRPALRAELQELIKQIKDGKD